MPTTTAGNTGFAKHAEYELNLPRWTRCRDASEGQQTVHIRGPVYLPKLTGATQAEHEMYLRRSLFFNATSRTVTGLVGTVMRKPTIIEYPESQVETLDDVGFSDEGVRDMIARTVHQQLLVGRVGHLVDATENTGIGDVSPYVSEYQAESIWNWAEDTINGRRRVVLVVLHETEVVPVGGKILFETMTRDRWRVLRLGTEPAIVLGEQRTIATGAAIERRRDPDQLAEGFEESDLAKPFYFQEIWVRALDDKGNETEDLVLEDVIVPRKVGGILWEEIPFTFTNAASTEPEVGKQPIIDLVDVNFSHYMNSADLEWGIHFTALPTPYIIGGDPKQKVSMGSTTAWVLPDPAAKVGMLEFKGTGLGLVRETMEHKEKQMAVLGSRLLEDQKTGVEAAAAIRLRLSGDGAILTAISMTASESWQTLLGWVWEWTNAGTEPEIVVSINRDFNPARLPPADMAILMQALQAGTIDIETWFFNLERGEVVPPGMTRDQFIANLLRGAPGVLQVTDGVEALAKDDEDEDPPDDGDSDDDNDEGDDDD